MVVPKKCTLKIINLKLNVCSFHQNLSDAYVGILVLKFEVVVTFLQHMHSAPFTVV